MIAATDCAGRRVSRYKERHVLVMSSEEDPKPSVDCNGDKHVGNADTVGKSKAHTRAVTSEPAPACRHGSIQVESESDAAGDDRYHPDAQSETSIKAE